MLRFKSADRFKVGIAQSLENRIRELGVRNFDLQNSIAYSASATVIKQLERQILIDFHTEKAKCSELSSGNTEVLNISCFEEVEAEADRKRTRFPQHNISKELGITLGTTSKKFSASSSRSRYNIERFRPKFHSKEEIRNFFKDMEKYANSVKIHKTSDGQIVRIQFDASPCFHPANIGMKAYGVNPNIFNSSWRGDIFAKSGSVQWTLTPNSIYDNEDCAWYKKKASACISRVTRFIAEKLSTLPNAEVAIVSAPIISKTKWVAEPMWIS